jgi:hypothetical protein
MEAAAGAQNVKATRIAVRNSTEIEPSINAFSTEPDGGIIVVPPVGALPSK